MSLRVQSFKPLQTKKQTSFKEVVEEIEPTGASAKQPKFHLGHDDDEEEEDDSDAIETDSEDDDELLSDEDEVSESAIEDDDDGWEDDPEEKDEPRALNFHRVDSKPNLVSRRSLLTERVHEGQRAAAIEEAAMRATPPAASAAAGPRRSRTSTPNGPLVSTSPPDDISRLGSSASQPQPIIQTTTNTISPMAMSPRTTRRNMLANELGTSLRKHLLWERQHRNGGPAAPVAQQQQQQQQLPRRHTSYDMKKLSQFPDAGGGGRGGGDRAQKANLPGSKSGTRNNSWNDYFDNGLGEYHQKGW